MGDKIQQNSAKFFENLSRPSGMLTAPGEISDGTATRLKTYWEENFSGSKIGRLAVLGDGLKYEAMTIPAVDAQLIQQLEWTLSDVARAFHVPLYKVGGPMPSTPNEVEALDQFYYSSCLQVLIEALELSLDAGLELPNDLSTEFDLRGLMRMNTEMRYRTISEAIKGGWLAPNEGRRQEDYPPVTGGESPMMQQQNWSLAQLAGRSGPTDGAAPPPTQDDQAKLLLDIVRRGLELECEPAEGIV